MQKNEENELTFKEKSTSDVKSKKNYNKIFKIFNQKLTDGIGQILNNDNS